MTNYPEELNYSLTRKDLFSTQITVLRCSFSRPFMKVMNIGIFLFLLYNFYNEIHYDSFLMKIGLALGFTLGAIISWCAIMLIFFKILGIYQYKSYQNISCHVSVVQDNLAYKTNVIEINFPFHQLEKVINIKNGIVLRFGSLSYLHLPAKAFSNQEIKDDWKNFLINKIKVNRV